MDLPARDLRVVLETVMDAAEAVDEAAFADRVLLGVDALVPGEIETFNIVDVPRRRAAVVSRPPEALSPLHLARFEELVHQHPLIAHFERRPGDARALAISDFLTRRRLHATELHRDFFSALDVEDQLAVNLPTGDGTVVGVAISRSHPTFTERERALLELLRSQLDRSLRSVRERARVRAVVAALEHAADVAGTGVVLLAGGRVEHLSVTAAHLLGGGLPPVVAAAVAAGLDPPAVVEHHGRRLACTLTRGEVDVLTVRERPAPPPGHRLTPRELAVLEHARDGLSDREIAEALRISARTVHRHLQNAYGKLGVRNRTAAVARVFKP